MLQYKVFYFLGHAEIAEESASEKFPTVKEMSIIMASPVKRTSTPGYPDDGLEIATVSKYNIFKS